MRYGNAEIEAVLRVARAARALDRVATTTENYSSADILIRLAEAFPDQMLELLEIVVDHEERAQRIAKRFRSWRRHRPAKTDPK